MPKHVSFFPKAALVTISGLHVTSQYGGVSIVFELLLFIAACRLLFSVAAIVVLDCTIFFFIPSHWSEDNCWRVPGLMQWRVHCVYISVFLCIPEYHWTFSD